MDKKQKTKKKLNLSRPKKKSCPSSSHFICDKEVVVRLERLSDSVVAEMTAGGSALPPEQLHGMHECIYISLVILYFHFLVNESNDDTLDINSLPNEIILKVFGFLEQNQLGQIARVCSRWNMLIRSPVLWKKVDVKFHCYPKSHSTMTRCFINMLPSCVTSVRLYYSYIDWTEELNFHEFCVRLQRRCHHLETLILEHVYLSDNLPSVIGLCAKFLPGVKILVFHYSTFSYYTTIKFGGLSQIEVLDVSNCNIRPFQELPFSNMPQLRVLNLGNSWIGSPAFLSLQKHGLNLEELYLCGAKGLEDDLIFSNSMFPHLKIICLCCPFFYF